MTRGGRRGRSNAPSRGVHHQTDLDETPHDSSVSPLCRTRHPTMTEGGPPMHMKRKTGKADQQNPP